MKNNNLFVKFTSSAYFEDIDHTLKMTVREAVKKTLEYEKFPYNASVSVTFCDNGHIRKLNKAYRNKDCATDVLSFPIYEDGNFDEQECSVCALIGDIVISLERAREQAAQIGNSFLKEVAFLSIHSTLHLLGYDHERSAEDEEKQCSAQRKIISQLKL